MCMTYAAVHGRLGLVVTDTTMTRMVHGNVARKPTGGRLWMLPTGGFLTWTGGRRLGLDSLRRVVASRVDTPDGLDRVFGAMTAKRPSVDLIVVGALPHAGGVLGVGWSSHLGHVVTSASGQTVTTAFPMDSPELAKWMERVGRAADLASRVRVVAQMFAWAADQDNAIARTIDVGILHATRGGHRHYRYEGTSAEMACATRGQLVGRLKQSKQVPGVDPVVVTREEF